MKLKKNIKQFIYLSLLVTFILIVYAYFNSSSIDDFIFNSLSWSFIGIIMIFIYLLIDKEEKNKKSADYKTSKNNLNQKNISKPIEFDERIIKKYKFNVAGVTFKCKLDKNEKRQEILKTCTEGEKLAVEKFLYKGGPAYLLVIDGWYKYDIGTVPADIAEEIADNYAFKKRVAFIDKISDFQNESNKTIIYAKVILYILDESNSNNDNCII